jgi:hypothetical protein
MLDIRVTPSGMIGSISCGMGTPFLAFSSVGKFITKKLMKVPIIFSSKKINSFFILGAKAP